jgi:hypothetical protein
MKPHVVSELERRLELHWHMPRLRRLSFGLVVITLGLSVGWPLSSRSRRLPLASGPVSNHHRLIEGSCERCHQSGFRGPSDRLCAECHQPIDHAAALPQVIAAHPELTAPCASCHKEHHGARSLVPPDSPMCTHCHRRLDQLVPKTEMASFADFDHHPEFAVHGWVGEPPTYRKVRMGEKSVRSDTQIKFSHKLHIELTPAAGAKPLACASCHDATPDGKDLRPISFARHCERCHAVEFDERLKGLFVPHGNSERVPGFVRAALARLHLEGENAPASADEVRQRVAKETDDDVAGLFTENSGCNRCHEVGELPAEAAPDHQHHWVVERPAIPAHWMPASIFRHGTHRLVACESCHQNRAASSSASDINLPTIARCRDCHADPPSPGKVASPCLQCHGYHARGARAEPATGNRSAGPG